jgi:hypothetical protein
MNLTYPGFTAESALSRACSSPSQAAAMRNARLNAIEPQGLLCQLATITAIASCLGGPACLPLLVGAGIICATERSNR